MLYGWGWGGWRNDLHISVSNLLIPEPVKLLKALRCSVVLLFLYHSEQGSGVLEHEDGTSPAVSRLELNPFGEGVNRPSVGVSILGGVCLGRKEQMDVDG